MSDDADLLLSPLNDRHIALGAKFGPFGGWSMPIEYPSGVVKEHTTVRTTVGVFDVSHLGKVTVKGPGAKDFVNATLSNDLGRIAPGKAQYTLCVDDASGGIVDDIFSYYKSDDEIFLIPNAANTTEVVARLSEAAPEGITITNQHRDFVVIAVQGTKSDEVLTAIGLPAGHEYLSFVTSSYNGVDITVCRTGYTGERGYELVAPNAVAGELWDELLRAGAEYEILACGLGARDTLRTEMGYPLHGQDISPTITPNEAGLGWAIGWKKDAFWGKATLVAEKEAGPKRSLRGIKSTGRAIPRPHMTASLTPDVLIGEVTSGTFSPTLKQGIGLVLIQSFVNPEAEIGLDVRGKREIFQLTPPPFVPARVREY